MLANRLSVYLETNCKSSWRAEQWLYDVDRLDGTHRIKMGVPSSGINQ